MPLPDSQLAALPAPLAGHLRALSTELELAAASAARIHRVVSGLPDIVSDVFWDCVECRIRILDIDPSTLGTALGQPPLLHALVDVYSTALTTTLDQLLADPYYLSHLTGSQSQPAPAPNTPSSQA